MSELISWPKPEFLLTSASHRRLQQAAFFVAVMLLGASAIDAAKAWDQRLQAQELALSAPAAHSAQEQNARRRTTPAEPLLTSTVELRSASPEAVASQKVWRRLQTPWAQLLESVERASVGQVQWLALEHDAEQNLSASPSGVITAPFAELRMEAQTPQTRDATQVVQALAAQPGWRDVEMRRWQRSGAADVGRLAAVRSSAQSIESQAGPWRFTVSARFSLPSTAHATPPSLKP